MRALAANSPWREGKLEQLEARYAAFLAAGFFTGRFIGPTGLMWETLQCRDATDQIRWLALLMKCQAAIANGAGQFPIDPPIRCTSNREYAVSHAVAAQKMMALMEAYGVGLKNLWRLKDAIRAAETREALNAIDLDEGWP